MIITEEFEKHFHPSGLSAASIKHFLETGKVSGGLHVWLSNQAKEFYNAGLMCDRILHESQNSELLDKVRRMEEEIKNLKDDNSILTGYSGRQGEQIQIQKSQITELEFDLVKSKQEILVMRGYDKNSFEPSTTVKPEQTEEPSNP